MKTQVAQEQKWQTEEDARTIQRAEEIKADKKRIARVKDYIQEQQTAFNKILKPTKKYQPD